MSSKLLPRPQVGNKIYTATEADLVGMPKLEECVCSALISSDVFLGLFLREGTADITLSNETAPSQLFWFITHPSISPLLHDQHRYKPENFCSTL